MVEHKVREEGVLVDGRWRCAMSVRSHDKVTAAAQAKTLGHLLPCNAELEHQDTLIHLDDSLVFTSTQQQHFSFY
jgi:hypothetical protein